MNITNSIGKKVAVIALFILLFGLLVVPVAADETESADTETQVRFATGYVPEENFTIPTVITPILVQGSQGQQNLKATVIPPAYDLRDYNQVTSVKNQGSHGICWSFAATNAFESNVMKKGYESSPNLSEYQLAYFHYNRTDVTNGSVLPNLTGLAGDNVKKYSGDYLQYGGNTFKTVNHLTSGIGMVKESDMGPYVFEPSNPSLGDQIIPSSYSEPKTSYVLKGAYYVNPKTNQNLVKEYLMTYGCGVIAYYTSGYLSEYKWNSQGELTYYQTNYDDSDHAVSLVGWNDSIKIEEDAYGNPVSETGAWLIKNSWGDSDLDNGYFWLAYNDTSVTEVLFVDVEPAYSTYDTVLQYDGGIYSGLVSGATDYTNWVCAIANNYTIEKDMCITDVALQFDNANVDYTITILKNGVSAGSTTGTTSTVGYYKIPLDSSVDTVAGDTVLVMVELTTPYDTTDIYGNACLTIPIDQTYTASSTDGTYVMYSASELGQSYIYDYQNSGWLDINDPSSGSYYYKPGNLRIKAFGTEIKSSTKIVTAPSLTGYDQVYNGSAITVAIPVNANYSITGETTKTAVGTYTATVALNDKTNTRWSTGGTADLSIVWNITNATMTDVSVTQDGQLIYNGTAQVAPVITTATTVDASTAVFTYSTAQSGTYAGTVPAFTAAGSHTVYYIATAANHADTSGSFTVTIEKANPTADNLTYSLTSVDYDGVAHPVTVTANATGLGTITVRYNGVTDAPVSAGTYAVTVDITEGTNYNATTGLALGNFIINKSALTASDISVTPAFTAGVYTIEYGTSFSGFTATSSKITTGTLSVTYNGNPAPAPTAKGSYTVNVSVSGDTNYTDADFTVGTFNITGKIVAAPSLTGYDKTYNGSAITVAIPVNANYSITGETTKTAVGTYTATVALSDTANSEWSTGGTADLSIVWNITNATMTGVSVTQDGQLIYNGAAQTAAVTEAATTVDASTAVFTYSTEESGTYTGTVPAFTAAGSHTVYYLVTAANHADASGSFTVTIGKAALTADNFTVTPSLATPITYDGLEHPVSVEVKSGILGNGTLAVQYDGGSTIPKNVGEYVVTVTAAEGQNYTATSAIALGTLNITAKQMTDADISITPTTSAFTYDGTEKQPGIAVMDGTTTLTKGTDYSITNESATNAGTYIVVVTGTGNYAGTNSSVSWTISKATPTVADVTMNPAFTSGVYSIEYGTSFSGFTVSSTNIASGSLSVTYDGNPAPAPTAKGSYRVNVSVTGDTNYADADFMVGTFNITGKIVTVPSLTGYDQVYNGSAITVAIPAHVNYTISGDTTKTDVGTYTATVALNDKTNTEWSTGGTADLSIVWNITNATMTGVSVTQDGQLIYNGAAQTAAVTETATTVDSSVPTFTYSTAQSGTYTGTVPAFTAAGSHTVYYQVTAANHADASGSFTVTIGKAALTADNFTVTPSLATPITYDGLEHPVSVDVKSGILGNGTLAVQYDGSSIVPKNVGEYAVTVTAAEGQNYTATSAIALGTLNITAKQMTDADISITPTTSAFTYDGTAKQPGITVMDGTTTLTKGTDYSITNESATNAGTYIVVVTGTGNYAGTNSSVSWTISKATPTAADFTVTPAIADVQYDGQPHAFTVTSTKITDGTKTVTYNGAATAPSAHGTYQVNVSLSGATNYEDADVVLGTFNITKTWPQASDFDYTAPTNLTYDMGTKVATVTTSNTELQNNYTVRYLQNGVETAPVGAGTYAVNVSVIETTNYAAREFNVGSFTIAAKPMTDAMVTLSATAFTYTGVEQTVSVSKVNFTDTWILTATDYDVSGTTQASAANTYTVTVTGKDNYSGTKSATWVINKATPVKENFTASNASGTVTFPLDVEFNNSEHTVTVAPASGVYGMGTITTTYRNVSSGSVETPKKVGSYYVNISTAAGTNFTAVSDLNLGVINVNTKSYTLTYVTNGGTAIASETYNAGAETKVLNTSTNRTGYHLDGWYANSGLTGTKVTEVTMTDFGDKTFYAKWINNTYQVSFDKNSTLATGTMKNQGFTYDAPAVALTANAFTYPGYHFANWTNATGTLFADKQMVQNLNATDGGITTLSAVWEPNTYTVHFDGNRNTSGSMTDQVFTYDVAQTLTANAYARAGYTFANWTTKADGTGTSYADGASVQNLTTTDNGIVTLYAKWTPAPAKEFTNTSGSITLDPGYTVSEIDVSSTNISKISFVYEQSISIPARSGYTTQRAFGDAFNITVTDGDFTSGKAVVNFNVSVSDMQGLSEANVWLAHLKNGAWEFLKTTKTGSDSMNIFFSAETTSFSPFWPVYLVQNTASSSSSGSSSRHSGGSTIIQSGQVASVEAQTPESTTTPTAVSTADVPSVPVANPTTQQTQKSPAPFVGIIVGLGAAALVLRRMRK